MFTQFEKLVKVHDNIKEIKLKVVKRNGKSEEYNCKKIKKAVAFACEGLDVNPLKLEAKFDEFLFDGVATDSIQNNLVNHAKNLATPVDDKWVFVAGRLAMMNLWNQTKAYETPFLDFVKKMIGEGVYKNEGLLKYTDEEIVELSKVIDKNYDLKHSISSYTTFKDKYLVKGEVIQYVNMVDAMIYASVESKHKRLGYAKDWYLLFAERKLSKATPHWTGLRFGGNTGSCFVLEVGDSLESIMNNALRTAKISNEGGGVGTYWGRVRAKGDMIGGEYGLSGGVLPMIKIYNDSIVAFNQRGKRKGAITIALPLWHKDVEDFLESKSEVGDLRTKLFDTQPQIVIPDLFMRMKEEDKTQIWYTFSPHEVEVKLGFNLNDYFGDDFENKYRLCIQAYKDGLIKVVGETKVIELWKQFLAQAVEKGTPYVTFGDHLQDMNPNKHDGKIHSLNLCVAPETKILTCEGYQIISELEGENVDVWNGKEWSETTVIKTSPLESVVSVETDDGATIDCTKYHKWYVVKRDDSGKLRGMTEKRTHELRAGDELIKSEGYDTVLHGSSRLDFPYESGFVTGDGCERGRTDNKGVELTLYKQSNKFFLKDVFKGYSSSTNLDGNVVLRWKHGTLLGKYNIPDSSFVLQDRLQWLAGLLDADGSILKGGESFVLNTSKKDFAQKMKLFLQEIGVDCTCGLYSNSKTTAFSKKTSSNYQEIPREPLYVVRVHAKGVTRLLELGLKCKLLDLVRSEKSRSTSSKFVKIVSVSDFGRETPVFCFTEHKRNMGMFNGILTGQCVESSSNFKADEYAHTCSLLSIVVGRMGSKQEIIKTARSATRILANTLALTKSPVDISAVHVDRYRTIGVGIQGLVDYLAKNFSYYSDEKTVREVAELIQWGCVLESMEMAKEFSPYPKFEGSRWATGEQFDSYIENSVSDLTDWEWLKAQVMENGVYCSQHTSPAPNTSTSIAMDAQAGVMPPYAEFFFEDNKNGKLPVTSMYLKDNPLLYSKPIGAYNQSSLTKMVGNLQLFVDTSISAEYAIDKNYHNVTVKDVSDIYDNAWKNKTKAVYYLRTIKKGESVVDKSDVCISCAG